MAPPQFGKIGSKVKDLFSKKYDYHNSTKVTKKGDELTIEAGGNDKSGDFAGNVVATYKNKDLGEHEFTLNTSSDPKYKGKFSGFQPGADATISSSLKKFEPTLEVNHKSDSTACQLKFQTDLEKHSLSGSACYGLGDITLGLSGATKDFSSLSACDASLEYSAGSTVLSVVSKKFFGTVGLSYFDKWSDSINWGASITVLPEVSDLTVGGEYNLDKSTTIKGKMDTNGIAAGAIEHKLKDPNFKLNLAMEFDTNSTKATNFGVGLSFGDY